MTETERQQKIARSLSRIAALLHTAEQTVSQLERERVKLETLAQEFQAGRYLPPEPDAEPAPAPV
jgi:exonuclease VII small subunit